MQPVTTPDELAAFATTSHATAIVTTRVPIGYAQAALARWMEDAHPASAPILQIQRRGDQLLWPHAKAGFFQLKDKIPAVLQELRIIKTGHTA